jgi:anti-sigma B factor antagonist
MYSEHGRADELRTSVLPVIHAENSELPLTSPQTRHRMRGITWVSVGESMILEIAKKAVGTTVVLEMSGRITLGRDCQQIESDVDELLRNKQTRVVFDLSKIRYMDSSGVGILVMCSGKIKGAGGELRIAGATGVVAQTLTLTRMNLIVPVYDTVEQALEGFSESARAS